LFKRYLHIAEFTGPAFAVLKEFWMEPPRAATRNSGYATWVTSDDEYREQQQPQTVEYSGVGGITLVADEWNRDSAALPGRRS